MIRPRRIIHPQFCRLSSRSVFLADSESTWHRRAAYYNPGSRTYAHAFRQSHHHTSLGQTPYTVTIVSYGRLPPRPSHFDQGTTTTVRLAIGILPGACLDMETQQEAKSFNVVDSLNTRAVVGPLTRSAKIHARDMT